MSECIHRTIIQTVKRVRSTARNLAIYALNISVEQQQTLQTALECTLLKVISSA
jgi:hypothetical protein